jgi:DNA-binding CsgD family transcriptional regulator
LLRITCPSGKQAYVATRVKAAEHAPPQSAHLPHLAVLIHDPEANTSARVTAIRNRYALTAAEGQIIAALLKTGSAKAAAGHLGSSENTMKTHLKSIFSKTGVHRQSELIQLALSFPRL